MSRRNWGGGLSTGRRLSLIGERIGDERRVFAAMNKKGRQRDALIALGNSVLRNALRDLDLIRCSDNVANMACQLQGGSCS